MKISIICSSTQHPVYSILSEWVVAQQGANEVTLVNSIDALPMDGGDLLFLVSCGELVSGEIRRKFTKTLVIHASDLPSGRGWSPHIWTVINGSNTLTVSLLEAEESVDTGDLWCQKKIHLEGHELYDEINDKLFAVEIELMDFAIENFYSVVPTPQKHGVATYFSRRGPSDSELELSKSLEEQFNLLRVSDPERYPAYFEYMGIKYKINIEKI